MYFMLCPLAVKFDDRLWALQTVWIQMRPHKMKELIRDPNCFDTQIMYQQKNALQFLKERKNRNIYSSWTVSCQSQPIVICKQLGSRSRVTQPLTWIQAIWYFGQYFYQLWKTLKKHLENWSRQDIYQTTFIASIRMKSCVFQLEVKVSTDLWVNQRNQTDSPLILVQSINQRWVIM